MTENEGEKIISTCAKMDGSLFSTMVSVVELRTIRNMYTFHLQKHYTHYQ